MQRSRFSEEHIIAILKQQERCGATADVCREHAISSVSFYKWKVKFGGLEVSDTQRLKTLEDENAKASRREHVIAKSPSYKPGLRCSTAIPLLAYPSQSPQDMPSRGSG